MSEPLQILLVEDNPGDAFLITEFLSEEESQPFEVTHVARLDAAVHSANERDFAVVLLDLGLPDSAGLETFRTMRSRKPDLPVVVLTGNNDDRLALVAIREGAQDYVVKNEINGELLRRVLRYALERHQSLVRFREQEEQLRQAQKMEAIGQLAGGIAHDFNNLLTAILGYSDLVLCRTEAQNPDLRGEMLQIKKAAERAGALTRQILAFSRRQALRPAVISINDVLEQMEPLLRRTLSEDIALVTSLHPETGHAEVDVHQFEQVLMNLALNARDAMPHGGRLVLETGKAELDSEWCRTHENAEPGGYVTLTVTDNGTGMDEVTRSRVFEPFFTTKAPGQGTGLGLSMVYGIVKQSGGVIDLYSEPGKGTVFKVYLPRVTKPVSCAPASSPELSSLPCNETILVVEDEPALRDLLAQVLCRVGYKVLVAGDAEEALAIIARERHSPDLLLTDVVLPGSVQGKELVERIQCLCADLPVLYMSGFARDFIVHSGRLDEEVNFLEKPFTSEALARMVRQVLDGRQTAGRQAL